MTTKNDAFNDAKSVIVHCIPELKFYFHSKSDATITQSLVFAPSPQAYDKPLSSDPSQIYLQDVVIKSSGINTRGVKYYDQEFEKDR